MYVRPNLMVGYFCDLLFQNRILLKEKQNLESVFNILKYKNVNNNLLIVTLIIYSS